MQERGKLDEAVNSDRGSVVNPGSEDDELLHATEDGIEARTAMDVGQRQPSKPAPDGVPEADDSRSDGGESGAGGLPIETH